MHLIIIGAGPIGSYAAWQHAAKGRDVTLIEEHATIGTPVQCTGILTNEITRYLSAKDLKRVTVANVTHATIHSPHREITVPLGKEHIIDNEAYDQFLAGKASDAGATIKTSTRYLGNTTDIQLKDLKHDQVKTHQTDLLLGADGPSSSVAKHNGLFGKRTFYTGIQAVMDVKDYDDKIHFYPAIGAYAWYCPAGDGKARIGIAAKKNARQVFNDFIKRYEGTTCCMQGGAIPHYQRQRLERRVTSKKGALTVQLIGDAAMQVKDTTGGGIIPGTKAASIHTQDPLHYERNLRGLRRELWLHQTLNNALQRMSGNEWDKLLTQVDNEQIKTLLAQENRDNARTLVPKILLAKPALALWARKLF